MQHIKTKIKNTGEDYFIQGWDNKSIGLCRGIDSAGQERRLLLSSLEFKQKGKINNLHDENFFKRKIGTEGNLEYSNAAVEEFKKRIPFINSDKKNVLFKLYYGKKYIIHKGMTLSGSLFLIAKGIVYNRLFPPKQGETRPNHYIKFEKYVNKNQDLEFKVEILECDAEPYLLLCMEQQLLLDSIKDRHCLNQNIHAYIPKLIKDEMYGGWIPKKDVDKYKQLFKDQLNFNL